MGKINKSYLKDRFKAKKSGQEGLYFRAPYTYKSLPISHNVYGPETPQDAKERVYKENYINSLPHYNLVSDNLQPIDSFYTRKSQYINGPDYAHYTGDLQGNRIPYLSNNHPSLEEYKSIYESLPRYNQGYASLTDADPKNSGIQLGPLTAERTQEIAGIPKEEELRKSYLGKTFGTLPLMEPNYDRENPAYQSFYEGYNPHRVWTSFVTPESKPFIGYQNPESQKYLATESGTLSNLDNYPLYAYFLTQKPKPLGVDVAAAKQQKLDNLYNNYQDYFLNIDYDYLEANGLDVYNTQYDYLKNDIINADSPNARVPNFWGYQDAAQKMGERIARDPKIQEYNKTQEETTGNLFNQGLEQGTNYAYAPQLAEALLAKRHVDASGMDVGYASSGEGFPVIQNPEAFTLTGYLPITKDMYYTNPEGKVVSYWDDPVKRKEYLLKAGVPENMLDQVYIHTNPFPLEEYKPRKDAQGNVYQKGGKVKSKLKTSYKNRRG
jgi:hypothetical protein